MHRFTRHRSTLATALALSGAAVLLPAGRAAATSADTDTPTVTWCEAAEYTPAAKVGPVAVGGRVVFVRIPC